MFSAALQGFTLSISLIAAIGAQNAYVLKQAATKNHPLAIALLCMLIDATLITLGSMGIGPMLSHYPIVLAIAALAGAALLLFYAVSTARSLLKGESLSLSGTQNTHSLRKVILTTLAISLLNPHVYLDTMLLIGSMSTQFQGTALISYTTGAIFASILWFTMLAGISYRASDFLLRPRVWQVLNTVIIMVMLSLAWYLLSYAIRLLG